MKMGPLSLGENSIGRFERQHVMRCQICGVLEYATQDTGPDPAGNSLLLGLSGPDAQPDVQWSLAEVSVVVAWHRAAAALKTVKRQLTPATTTTTTGESRLVPW